MIYTCSSMQQANAICSGKTIRTAFGPGRSRCSLREHPELIAELFATEADHRPAAFAAAIVPFANLQRPMTPFFLMQPIIEAALDNWRQVRGVLGEFGLRATTIVDAMTTPLRAQRIAADGRSLIGENRIVLTNDQDWEGHPIEGPFVTFQKGRYVVYAGNDFSTPSYGIGVAVGDDPAGPLYQAGRAVTPLDPGVGSAEHASVAPGRDGEPAALLPRLPPRDRRLQCLPRPSRPWVWISPSTAPR